MVHLETKHLLIVQDILHKYPYSFYAYGSRIKDTYRSNSDLDICFFENIPLNIQGHIDEDFENSDLPISVDLCDFNLMQESFRRLIIDELVLLQSNEKLLAVEKNLYAKFCYLPEKMGYSVDRALNNIVINSRLQTSMFNIVCKSNFLEACNVNVEIKKVIGNFVDMPFAWWLGPSSFPKTLSKILRANGFIKETNEFAMWLELDKFVFSSSDSELAVKRVETIDDLKDFNAVLMSIDIFAPNFYEKLAAIDFAHDANFSLFVGYLHGKAVVIGSLFFTDNVAGVFDLYTISSFRKQGFGETMLQSMLIYAKNLGYANACLSASSSAGLHLYQKNGFYFLGLFECLERK